MKRNVGQKGRALGKILAGVLEDEYPNKIIIVHHFTNFDDRVQLEVEIGDLSHTNCQFKRIFL